MIIEGPYDPNAPIAQAVGVLVIPDYELNETVRNRVHYAFCDAIEGLQKARDGTGDVLVMRANMSNMYPFKKSWQKTDEKPLAPPVTHEILSLKRAYELRDDPRYQNARGFQADPSDTIYRVIPHTRETEGALRVRCGTLKCGETTLPWTNPSGP